MDSSPITERKRQHLEMATLDRAQSTKSAGWDDVHLISAALPTASLAEVELTTSFLGHDLQAPLMIASMTGGHDAAEEINARLAEAAERLGIAIGSGSQRAALVDQTLVSSYAVLRTKAPTAFLMANVGACQLVAQGGTRSGIGPDEIETLVDMLNADALAVHLNVVEELIQPEGDRNTAGFVEAIGGIAAESPVPVVAKETGAGMAAEEATALVAAGVAAIDVGGAGGTSFARIEAMRSREIGDSRGVQLGQTFADWGIPTAISILETRTAGVPVIATGGVRTGLDAAKALALGADVVGVGRPVLVAAQKGLPEVVDWLEMFCEELRMAIVLTGARSVADLRSRMPVVTGHVREWGTQRGLL